MRHLNSSILVLLTVLAAPSTESAAQCPMQWAAGLGPPGMDGDVYALGVFDDGRGPALYAGGNFHVAGDAFAEDLAKWDAVRWSSVGDGPPGEVYAIAAFDDDGPGPYAPALYVGCATYGVRKWDGLAWTVPGGWVQGNVYALTVFDDGSGPALYAGGDFLTIDGASARCVAKFDGTSWSPLGSGMHPYQAVVYALAVYDDGTGPALYAGGSFSRAGETTAYNIAKWDGASWSALDYGTNGSVFALAVYPPLGGGGQPALCAGGDFTYAGSTPANCVARWDGAQWSPLGAGMGDAWLPGVYALKVFDAGSGPELYAGGTFGSAGAAEAGSIAKWDGADWSALDGGIGGAPLNGSIHQKVLALASFTAPGSGAPALFAGGDFTSAGGAAANRIARWDGTAFSSVGVGNGMSDPVLALYACDLGSGPEVYAGGGFTTAGSIAANAIAKWDGLHWSTLGAGLNVGSAICALTAFDDGAGPALYMGGQIKFNGSLIGVARWDGTELAALPGQFDHRPLRALTGFDDDGDGPHPRALYAGGPFTMIDGTSANHIAKWDGTSWSALASGLNGDVLGLAVYDDDGPGPHPAALYAGGTFTSAGGGTAWGIARWDGTSWSDVGGGLRVNYKPGAAVALTVLDDGSGPALYAGGGFTHAGGLSAHGVARWDGTSWSGTGFGAGSVCALTTLDDGRGPALYAGGSFLASDPAPGNGVARWDGTIWSALGSGTFSVRALAGAWQQGRPSLYIGTVVGGRTGSRVSAYLGQWTCAHEGDLNCDNAVNEYDIDPFVLALVAPASYEAVYPECPILRADCNGDGAVNAFDIDPFIELLLAP
jgi:hypothetical protein